MAQVTLDSSVQYLKGVGPNRVELLANLGIRTVGDLILHLPSRYDRQPEACAIGDLELGQIGTIVAGVERIRSHGGFSRPSVVVGLVDATGRCTARWFNAAWVQQQIKPGDSVRISGTVGEYRRQAQFVNPSLEVLADEDDEHSAMRGRILPVYPATEGITSKQIAGLVDRALPMLLDQIQEWYEPEYRRSRDLPPRRTAIERAHRPVQLEDPPVARRRLAYDELFLMQLAILRKRRLERSSVRGVPIKNTDEIDRRIRKRFPFKLTAAQRRAIDEIVADLARPIPMNRLLQGDVGAGKTVVALYAALLTVAHKHQVAIMAPTEILAEQHYRGIERYLAGSRVRTKLLVGGLSRAERADAIERIDAGEIDIVVGTQALLERDIEFNRLALVVIDEQHKFGVVQRATIRSKAAVGRPHYLVMTATPIPRTLALTFFGDLDVSVIDALPPGRKPIKTRYVPPDKLEEAWAFVRQRIAEGEQAFVVHPLVEESEAIPLSAATVEVERLRRDLLPGRRVDLLHGRMKPREKDDVMHRFAAGEIDVLAATTVIEVGIDVPNATVMVIQNAERFGLSQLHQLRGRIGRGSRPGYCLLMAEQPGDTARSRLSVLTRTTDGFRIAEEDLLLRGPGDLMGGRRQHGFDLKVADLISDVDLLTQARKDAAALIAADPNLAQPKHAVIKKELMNALKGRFELIDVG
ncbi:MAG: ATP-dependent DNA helicase RecG [Phycisphaerae bacterium]|nr:ATP-dependent DNA helicase RecG [Phycisphaerae bacterium]